MDNSETRSQSSKIPKVSGIPRPRSKGLSTSPKPRSRPLPKTLLEPRSKSAPHKESVDMTEPGERPLRYKDEEEEGYHQSPSQNNNSQERTASAPPNPQIPRYQGFASKYKQGILANNNYAPSPDHSMLGHLKSDFRSPALQREMENSRVSQNDESFATPTMFPRAHHTHPYPASHSISTTPPSTQGSWGRKSEKSWGNTEYPTVMSPNNNSTIGYKSSYSTAEELDMILAKYKAAPHPHQQEYSAYPAMTQKTNYPVPESNYFSNSSYTTKAHQNRPHNRMDSHKVENISKKYGERTQSPERPVPLGVFGIPLDSSYQNKQNGNKYEDTKSSHSGRSSLRHPNKISNRVFPFKETQDGELVVDPEQIAFESKAITVLMSDPSKLWDIKSEKIHDVRNQEKLLKEVEGVIQKGLNKFYIGSGLSDSEKEDEHSTYQKNIENEYLHKEMVTGKYSDAKTGTDKLMMEIHHRLRSGKHADTHVMIADKIYPCHSVALEVVSRFFDNLPRPKDTLRRIELPDAEVPATIFPTLMDWILQSDHGRTAIMTKSNVVQLFSCGKYLDISELKSQCVNFLQEKIETNDRHLMLLWEEVKKRPNCHELMVVISAKAALSFQHIFKEKKFLHLDVDELVMLLSSDDIVIESELDIFDTSVQWLLHSWENRKVFTNEVVNTVRFGLLTPLQLTQIAHSPDLAKGTSYPNEYPELLTYGSVKAMIDDGLAYSIVNESYKGQPEEIRKWVHSTGIKAPRPRNHTNPSSKSKMFIIPNDPHPPNLQIIKQPSQAERKPSYTLFPQSDAATGPTKLPGRSRDSSGNRRSSTTFDGSDDEQQHHHHQRPHSRGAKEQQRKFDTVADTLGQIIKEEDIQSFRSSSPGRPGSGSSSSRSRPRSKDQYGFGKRD